MTETNSAPNPPGPSALTAFLHGIEPRAWVFALSQSGDPDLADMALESAMEDFVGRAGPLPLADWPMQFWSSLMKQPVMLAELEPELDLARLTPGPRAALLLRLIASLDVAHAADVLGVSPGAYEAALGQALADPALGGPWLQDLREQLHDLIHQMPVDRRAALAAIRTRVIAEHAARGQEESRPVVGRRRAPFWSWLLLGALLLTLLASFLLPIRALLAPGQSEPLPRETIAPAPGLTDSVVVTHPDYGQVAEPADETVAADLAFLSWLTGATALATAESDPAGAAQTDAAINAMPDELRPLLSSATGIWDSLEPDDRRALLANARDWRTRTAGQRDALRLRLRAWDRQSAPARASRRSPFVSWRALDDRDRVRLRAAAARLGVLPEAEQQALRAQFAMLPADVQRLWWMGPTLGRELAPFAPLFAFVPEAERPPLLDALRLLEPAARADLALLAPRLDEAQRDRLRRELLAAAPGQRASLIRSRLAQ